ncbi:MAG: U32 family peptidase, partial [Candidatus Cryptobacteroides sp.]
AYLGQWSEVYGSQAKFKKVYVGKVTNWFDRIGVAEILVESAELRLGDKVMGIGQTTGVEEFEVQDMRVNFQGVDCAHKGERCSVAVPAKLKRGDKIYKWEENI